MSSYKKHHSVLGSLVGFLRTRVIVLGCLFGSSYKKGYSIRVPFWEFLKTDHSILGSLLGVLITRITVCWGPF